MSYDFKDAKVRIDELRRRIIEQKGGKSVEGLSSVKPKVEKTNSTRKIKNQEKTA